LTAAIAAGSRDPRVFYFRGLAYLKFGRTSEAEMDFQKGAELESRDINKYYNVGRALERVQGSDRQLLETYRVQARMAAYEESEKVRKARYEALKREESRVLQQQPPRAQLRPENRLKPFQRRPPKEPAPKRPRAENQCPSRIRSGENACGEKSRSWHRTCG